MISSMGRHRAAASFLRQSTRQPQHQQRQQQVAQQQGTALLMRRPNRGSRRLSTTTTTAGQPQPQQHPQQATSPLIYFSNNTQPRTRTIRSINGSINSNVRRPMSPFAQTTTGQTTTSTTTGTGRCRFLPSQPPQQAQVRTVHINATTASPRSSSASSSSLMMSVGRNPPSATINTMIRGMRRQVGMAALSTQVAQVVGEYFDNVTVIHTLPKVTLLRPFMEDICTEGEEGDGDDDGA